MTVELNSRIKTVLLVGFVGFISLFGPRSNIFHITFVFNILFLFCFFFLCKMYKSAIKINWLYTSSITQSWVNYLQCGFTWFIHSNSNCSDKRDNLLCPVQSSDWGSWWWCWLNTHFAAEHQSARTTQEMMHNTLNRIHTFRITTYTNF